MASTAAVAPPPVLNAGENSRSTPQGIGNHTEHFRGGRGGSQGASTGEGERGGRGRGRGQRVNRSEGRGNQKTRRQPNESNHQSPPIPPPPGLGSGGTSSGRSTRDAKMTEGEVLQGQQQDKEREDVEAEVCFICASPVIHNSVAPCNHRTCHICALRLRALYKTRACAHCRVRPAPILSK